MMEQLGKPPIEEEIPPTFEDFPEIAQDAILIFNALGNRIIAEVGYIGKSYDQLLVESNDIQIQSLHPYQNILLKSE